MAKHQNLSAKNNKSVPKVGLFALFLFTLSFLLYSNTLYHRFAFDDSIVITENKYTQEGFQGIPDLLTKDMFMGIYGEQLEVTGGRYRPLSLLMFAIEFELFGLNPLPGHLINILLYGILVILLFLTLNQVSSKIGIALLAAAIFATHPIHSEVVANIKSRDEILCFVFSLLASYAFLRNAKNYSMKWLILGLVSFTLALLAKETAVIFLILIPVAVHISFPKRMTDVFLRYFSPLFLVFILYFIVRTNLVGMPGGSDSTDIMENPFVNASLSEKYATISMVLGKYIGLSFYPSPLSCDYSYNQIPISGWGITSILLMLAHFAALAYGIYAILRRQASGYALLLYLLPLSLTSNLLFNIGAPMGERFIFISSAGFCFLIPLLLEQILEQKITSEYKRWKYLILAFIPVLLFYSWFTVDRNKAWKDNLTLFSTDVNTVPNSAKIHYYYGNTLQNRYSSGKNKDLDKIVLAKKEFKRSVRINPEFHWAHFNLGKTYDYLEMPDSAIIHLERVLELKPTHISTHGLLGSIYGKSKGEYQNAIYYLSKAIEYGDESVANFHNLAIAYALSGNHKSAIENFLEAVKRAPKNARINYELGMTYDLYGDKANAEKYISRAYQLDPALKK